MRQLILLCLVCIPCMAQRNYNPQTVETVTGIVASVETTSARGGVHITLDNSPLSIHLGPSWYIHEQGMRILEDDPVTITGSRITMDGEEVLIASKITKDGKTVTLRDESGIPLWSRSRY